MRGTRGWMTVWLALFAGAGCGGPATSSEELTAALEAAQPGDVVEVAAGTFEGSFVVPAGVELTGAGAAETRLVAPSGVAAVRIEPGSPPTTLRAVAVVADAQWAVVARGVGSVALDDVTVEVPVRGVGVGIEGLTEFRASGLRVLGPVTMETAGSIRGVPSPGETAPFGLVLVDVGSAQLSDLEVRGFAAFGAVAVRSSTAIDGGEIRGNVGVGLMVHAGSATLSSFAVRGSWQGSRLVPPYNILAAGGAVLDMDGVETTASEGYGAFFAEASGTLQGFTASGNRMGGLWGQSCHDVSLIDATFEDNGFVGITLLDCENVSLVRVTVRGTTWFERLAPGGTTTVGYADGIQIVDAMRGLAVEDLLLVENHRVGLLLHMESDDLSTATMGPVAVEGTGEMLGVVAQGASLPAGWDESVERSGSTIDNDLAFSGTLDVVEVVAPSDLPLSGTAAAFDLDAVVAPSD